MVQKIHNLLQSYKSVGNCLVKLDGKEAVVICAPAADTRYLPNIAKKILDKFSDLRWVYFTGQWTTHVYSRNTLSYMGY